MERAFKIFVQHGSPCAERAQRRLAQMEVKMMPLVRPSVRPSVLRGFVEAVRRSLQEPQPGKLKLGRIFKAGEISNRSTQAALKCEQPETV